jgi:hypothetical protein
MQDKYITIHKFSNNEEALEACALLGEHEIIYSIEEEKLAFDVAFSYSTAPYSIHLKVREEDAEAALKLLNVSSPDEPGVTFDSFLNEFSDEELKEVIYKKDEWQEEDIERADLILQQRGIRYSEADKSRLWQERLEEMRRPQRGSIGWIIFGFVISLLGGLIGIVMGLAFGTLKKRDPEGRKFYVYDARTRNLGLLMVVAGIIVFLTVAFFGYHTPRLHPDTWFRRY